MVAKAIHIIYLDTRKPKDNAIIWKRKRKQKSKAAKILNFTLNNFITFNYYYKRFLTQIHDAACSLSCQFVPPQLPQNQQLLHPADDGIETSLVCVKECIWKKLWRSPKLHLQLRNKNFSTEFMPLPRSLNYVERVIL